MPSDADITRQLYEALRLRYCEPEWLMWEEMSMDGWGRIDALAINAFQSSGHVIHGIEVKSNRRDWLNELKRMSKSNGAFPYCDRWWLVAVKGVCLDGELPKTWGLLELASTGSKLLTKVRAPALVPEKQLTVSHMIRMARRARREVTIDDQVREARDEGYKNGMAAGKVQRDWDRADSLRKAATLDAFEKELGQKVHDFQIKDLAAAIHWAMNGDRELRSTVGLARQRAKKLMEATEWLETGGDPPVPDRNDRW